MAYQLLLYKSIEMHLSNTPIMDMNIIMQDTWLKGLGVALLLRRRKRKNPLSNFRMPKMGHNALISMRFMMQMMMLMMHSLKEMKMCFKEGLILCHEMKKSATAFGGQKLPEAETNSPKVTISLSKGWYAYQLPINLLSVLRIDSAILSVRFCPDGQTFPAQSNPNPHRPPLSRSTDAASSSPATPDSTSACSNRARSSVRKEMEEFQAAVRGGDSRGSAEAEGGAEQCDVLEVSNNTEIAAGEARKPDLTAKKAKLGESMASAR
ncbi:uncharacterized protein [Zea mays]|uniref:uncharacterized protein n=1 Tax=Zea mays TaxID=4577 RepID=UPI001651E79F|nr:uncharacterized protein LOC103628527 [Zea mays]